MIVLLDLLVGGLWCVGGGTLLVATRPSTRFAGRWMLLVGTAWLLGSLWPAATFLYRGPLVQVVVGYPNGRLRGRLPLICILGGYLWVIPVLGADPIATIVGGGMTIIAVAVGRVRAPVNERAQRSAAVLSATAVMGVLIAVDLLRMIGLDADPQFLVAFDIAMCTAAAALFAETRWGRSDRAAVSGLAVELGAGDGGGVRNALAAALGDASLQLATIDPGSARLVDELGDQVNWAAAPAPGRVRTLLPGTDRPVALLEHAPETLADPALLEPTMALAAMAVTNATLQTEVIRRAAEVQGARRALVTAIDRARQALERDLHDGPLHRLDHAAAELAGLPDDPSAPNADLAAAVARATASVIEFARGVRPRALDEGGLPAALADLTGSGNIPITCRIPEIRLPAAVELTLYFVAVEALTNALKHAHAGRIDLAIQLVDTSIRLEITDNGQGLAELQPHSGLTGLADRLAALDGTLEVHSSPGTGTTVIATVPRA